MTKIHGVWMLMLLYLTLTECKVTMEQMKKSSEMIRNVCQPKVKISDELANGVREGKFPNEKVLKCYIQCVLEMSGSMKKNKLNYDAALKQMDLLLPEEMIAEYKIGLNACKDAANGVKDACEAAYILTQCFYNNNKKFTFP